DLPTARLFGLWAILNGNEKDAGFAVKELAARPDQVIPFLKQRLTRALAQESPYARLIADLDRDEFAVREKASSQLEAGGAKAEVAMRLALEGAPSAEASRRMRRALANIAAARDEQIDRLIAGVEKDQAAVSSDQFKALAREIGPALRRRLEAPRLPQKPGDK